MRRAADDRFRAKEQELEQQLRETEDKLTGAAVQGGQSGGAHLRLREDQRRLHLVIVTKPDGGVAKDDRLSNYSPTFKVKLLATRSSTSRSSPATRCVSSTAARLVKDR